MRWVNWRRRIRICSSSSAEKGRFVRNWRREWNGSRLGNHVRFAGFIPDRDLPVADRAAEFTILPSVALEGFGLVILESMAAGTPVSVTPVGGMPEVLRPFRPDCVLAGSSVEDLVKGIRAVLTGEHILPDPEACVDYVRRSHDWDDVARKVLAAYS